MFVRQNIRSLAHHRLPLIYCMDGMIKHGIDDAVDQIFRIIEWLCGGRAKRYCHLVNAPPRSSAAAARSFTVPLTPDRPDTAEYESCGDRKSTRLNSSHYCAARLPSYA